LSSLIYKLLIKILISNLFAYLTASGGWPNYKLSDMKKLLLTIGLAGCIALNTNAQTQPPNGGFETWITAGNDIEPANWGTLNQLSGFGAPITAFQATGADAYSGTYALRLESVYDPIFIIDTIPGVAGLNANFIALTEGMAYTDRPDSMKAFIKGTVMSGDVCIINAQLTKLGVLVGEATYTLTTSIGSYTEISVVFNYSLPDTPDTLLLSITAGDPNDPVILLGNILFIDELSFVFPPLPPTANLTASDTMICGGDCINFTDLSTDNPTSWQWSFPGGNPSTSISQNPTNICYDTSGFYDVQLIATNANGSDTLTKTGYIQVNNACPSPTANFTASNTMICEGGCINFMDLSANNPVSWQWSFPGGNPSTSTSQNPANICYATTGFYDVQLVVINANGSDFLIKTSYIRVNICSLPPTANFTANDTVICEGECINFTDLSMDKPKSWRWSFPGGIPSTSTSQNPTNICYNTAGFYDVQLIVTNPDGSDTLIKTGYIQVDNCPSPTANLTASDTMICEGDCINLIDLSTDNPISWQWSFPGGIPSTSTSQNPTNICYNTAGFYDVQLIATNFVGSADTLIKTGYIQVDACPGISEISPSVWVHIYPNPNKGQFIIEITNTRNEDYLIEVRNIIGQLVYTEQSDPQVGGGNFTIEIDLSGHKGVYFLRINNASRTRTEKLIVY